MKKIYTLFLLAFLSSIAMNVTAQTCQKTCEVSKEAGEGVFLGVQITSTKCNPNVRVVNVVEDTQAAKMNLQKGDLILKINNVPMADTPFMIDWVANQYAGMPITLDVKRNDENIKVKGKLGYKTVKMVTETICCDETIGKLQIADFKTYPNPSRGEFTVNFQVDNESDIDLKVVDMNGNVVFENTIYPKGGVVNAQLAINPQVSGDHILVLTQEGKTIEKKLVFIK